MKFGPVRRHSGRLPVPEARSYPVVVPYGGQPQVQAHLGPPVGAGGPSFPMVRDYAPPGIKRVTETYVTRWPDLRTDYLTRDGGTPSSALSIVWPPVGRRDAGAARQ